MAMTKLVIWTMLDEDGETCFSLTNVTDSAIEDVLFEYLGTFFGDAHIEMLDLEIDRKSVHEIVVDVEYNVIEFDEDEETPEVDEREERYILERNFLYMAN